MKKTKTNIPELRFPGFDGEWEEKKLGDIAAFFSGGTPSTSNTEYWDGDINWFVPSEIGKTRYVSSSIRKITNLGLENSSAKRLKKGTILLSTRATIGEKSILLTEGCTNQGFQSLEVKSLNSINFFFNYLDKLKPEMLKRSSGSTFLEISSTNLKSIDIIVPRMEEQTKIASFLEAVDQKIEQLEKMVALQEKYKKGMIQRIFNQEIRFKSSNGTPLPAWQQKKLGDVGAFISTNSFSRDKLNYERGSIYNIHYGDIHTKFRHLFSQERENVPFINESEIVAVKDEKLFCKEFDIIIADASEDYCDIGKTIEVVDTKQNKIMAGLHTLHFRPSIKFAKGFNAFQFQSSFIREQIQRFAQGISVLGISKANLQKLVINYPALEEQEKIAGFLSALDEKIEQSKAELEKAKNWKKGLMQRLFV